MVRTAMLLFIMLAARSTYMHAMEEPKEKFPGEKSLKFECRRFKIDNNASPQTKIDFQNKNTIKHIFFKKLNNDEVILIFLEDLQKKQTIKGEI